MSGIKIQKKNVFLDITSKPTKSLVKDNNGQKTELRTVCSAQIRETFRMSSHSC